MYEIHKTIISYYWECPHPDLKYQINAGIFIVITSAIGKSSDLIF